MRLLLPTFVVFSFLAGCKSISVPDVRECSVAGIFQAGAICATTNSGKLSEMNVQEFIAWLEPAPGRAGAVCRSDEDFTKQKTALEQACVLLKDRCTPEMKAALESTSRAASILRQKGKR